MLPTTKSLNKYHDKKRRLEYIKITQMIKEEETRKNNGGELPKDFFHKRRLNQMVHGERILADLDPQIKSDKILRSARRRNQRKPAELSNTIQDLNQKLGEIISNSRTNTNLLENTNYFESDMND